ncbi:MAG TPA: M1 family metallopeptidase [Solirubrobacterales bacterium]|nr:M1 family metallopeptidase [Solirubrobacterales bacterium]
MSLTRLSLFFCLLGCVVFVPAAAADEPFFPGAGNRGYDALDYDVDLVFEPKSGRIKARTFILARAETDLRRLSLDFRGPRIRKVRVDNRVSQFRRRDGKLVVFPRQPVDEGVLFTIDVDYRGVPPRIVDPDGTAEGWNRTDDGVIAVGEPQGTPAWIPCNNVPTDKASFSFDIKLPVGLKAVANGRRVAVAIRAGRARYHWAEGAPMSPYLAVLNIGHGKLVKSRAWGRLAWTLVDPRLARGSRPVLEELPRVIGFLSRLFGPYPFSSAGSLVDYAPDLGYALETQSRPIYAYVPDLTTLVHETAHQWFGNSVGLKRWPEIWLNEGFATWAQWYYAERHGDRSAKEIFERLRRVPASNEEFWNPPPGNPGTARRLFDSSIYVRGAMAVQALREEIGTKPLLRVLRRWTSEHRYGSATIPEFIALAEAVADRDLDPLFRRWLYQRGKPR